MDQAVKTEIDAITLLTQDHSKVKKMFAEYTLLGAGAYVAKQTLAMQICAELTVHTTIEEEIFYPAARAAIDDDDIMDEADVEHAGAKELITQIRCMTSSESHFDAKVKVLGEEIDHHVKEEQTEMFPKVKKSGLDTKALGARLSSRKEELKRLMQAA